jgi:hypothetical protein
MGLLDLISGKKTSRKRTYKEIRYDKILSKQQNLILESSLAANEALKMEVKSLRQVIFDQDDLQRDLGISPIEVTGQQESVSSTGEFNAAELIASVAKGLKPDNIPGGRVALDAFQSFILSNKNEVNALGSHYISQAMPKKEVAQSQVINQ